MLRGWGREQAGERDGRDRIWGQILPCTEGVLGGMALLAVSCKLCASRLVPGDASPEPCVCDGDHQPAPAKLVVMV